MEYRPDVWIIVEVYGTQVNQNWYRVLAGWYGGFAGSNSWKLSSGITGIEDCDTYWLITNFSGSKYYCHKECERLSMTTGMILNTIVNDSTPEISVRQVLVEEVKLLNN